MQAASTSGHSTGFSSIRTENVPVRFAFRDLDDYERWVIDVVIDVAGPFAMAVRGLPADEREVLSAHGSGMRSCPSPSTVGTSVPASLSAPSRPDFVRAYMLRRIRLRR
jgi:hypothetical protein